MASVRKREWAHKGEVKTAWVVAYTDGGGKRRLKTFNKRRDADAYRLQVENEIEAGIHVAASQSVTVNKAAEAWFEDCERRHRHNDGMTKACLVGYRGSLKNHIIPALGGVKLRDLDAERVRTFLEGMLGKYNIHTLRKQHRTLISILNFAMRKGWVKRNVISDHKLRVPGGLPPKVRVPSIDEIRKLLAAVDKRSAYERDYTFRYRRALVYLALFAGLRKAEAVALQWQHVRFDLGKLEVRHSLTGYDGLKLPKTKSGLRDVPMSQPVWDVLYEMHGHVGRPESGFVFLSRANVPIKNWSIYSHYWVPIAKKAGLCDADDVPLFHFHALRHAAVSLLIADGLSALHIKSIIGHASVNTTLGVYGHLFPEDEKVKSAVGNVAARLLATRERQELPSI